MKRDDDLIRSMLLEMEQDDDWLFAETMEGGADEHRRLYHRRLMADDGLLVYQDCGSYRLSAEGHNYLNAIRDEGIWSKTKGVVAESGGNATLEIMKALAVGFLKKKIKDHTDIDV
ncbi:MAG TPA: DUF2513 domain-containing protein [Thermohalobaculum sp.]|nr:DUF2513 domain-containing protein [Thermohalobaculum sp.]